MRFSKLSRHPSRAVLAAIAGLIAMHGAPAVAAPQVVAPPPAPSAASSLRPEPVTRAAKSGPLKPTAAGSKSKSGAEGKPAQAPATPTQDLLDDRQ